MSRPLPRNSLDFRAFSRVRSDSTRHERDKKIMFCSSDRRIGNVRKAEIGAALCDGENGNVTACDAERKEERKTENIDRAERHAHRAFGVAAPARPARPGQASGIWIAQSSPEWSPWADFWRATHGKSPPTDKRGGWRFPSRSPPALAAE